LNFNCEEFKNFLSLLDFPVIVINSNFEKLFSNFIFDSTFKSICLEECFNFENKNIIKNIANGQGNKSLFSVNIENKAHTCYVYRLKNDMVILLFVDISGISEVENIFRKNIIDIFHSLRNPISTILTALNLTEDNNLTRIAKNSARRLANLIEKLRILFILESNLKINLSDKITCEDILNNLKKFPQKRLNIKCSDIDNIKFKANKELLLFAINEIVENALLFSESSKTIDIEFKHFEDELIITIRDYGYGIKQENYEKIFKKFYYEKPDEKAITGAGIGLYLAREIIEQHGGYFLLESMKDVGTQVTLSIPVS